MSERFPAGAYWVGFGLSMDGFQSCVKFPCPVFVFLPPYSSLGKFRNSS